MFHKRKRMRLVGWDYSDEGTYFLTLCSKNRKPMFSEIVGHGILDVPEVRLTHYGRLIQESILFLDEHKPQFVFHNWVIMPNHVHILVSLYPQASAGSGTSRMPCPTGEEKGTSGMPCPTGAEIAKLVSSLKRFTNRKGNGDLWQISYYDHIIRNEQDFLRRWQYIENNPANWLDDDYFINDSLEVVK